VKVMVFKDLPLITIGHLMLNFGGTDAGHPANFIPFTTIVPYLFGHKGLIIAGINLVGNIILLVPVGFLVPFVYRSVTWRTSLAIATVTGLLIEVLQVALHVGIFDIDDVILNAFGLMIGYWAYVACRRLMASRFRFATIAVIVAASTMVLYGIVVNPRIRLSPAPQNVPLGSQSNQTKDPCGGTGGNGQIKRLESRSFTLTQNDGNEIVVTLSSGVVIKTAAGSASVADLKIGDRVTLVGDRDSDTAFTADAVFVCSK
jgi:glycopeptide antibiotics resistance protein